MFTFLDADGTPGAELRVTHTKRQTDPSPRPIGSTEPEPVLTAEVEFEATVAVADAPPEVVTGAEFLVRSESGTYRSKRYTAKEQSPGVFTIKGTWVKLSG